ACVVNPSVYTARLRSTVTAAHGAAVAAAVSLSFTTVIAAPTVLPTTPLIPSTALFRSASATATFSRPMLASSLSSASFTLTPAGGPTADATVPVASWTATLAPAGLLLNNTVYTARLETTVTAAGGVPLAAAVSWTCTTL